MKPKKPLTKRQRPAKKPLVKKKSLTKRTVVPRTADGY